MGFEDQFLLHQILFSTPLDLSLALFRVLRIWHNGDFLNVEYDQMESLGVVLFQFQGTCQEIVHRLLVCVGLKNWPSQNQSHRTCLDLR